MSYHLCYRLTSTREVRTASFGTATERAVFAVGYSPFIDVLEEWES